MTMKKHRVDSAFITKLQLYFDGAAIQRQSSRNWCSQGMEGRQIEIVFCLKRAHDINDTQKLADDLHALDYNIADHFVADLSIDNASTNSGGQVILEIATLILRE